MVISPREIHEPFAKREQMQIKRLEERIDKLMREGYDGSKKFKCEVTEQVDDESLLKVVVNYSNAGWAVQYNRRNKDTIEFCFKFMSWYDSVYGVTVYTPYSQRL
ncbi:MAG: hypothetical protein HY363_04025 [Candidatus Aenigmarchaeota archaeon]|nr:hypothetical protein [Candidatus Aenigmarchaeota archaeon]